MIRIAQALTKVAAAVDAAGERRGLAAERPGDPYRVLIACILSLRTKEETTGPAADRLFRAFPEPEDLAAAPVATIRRLIYPVGFYKTKARVIRDAARRIITDFDGAVPDTMEALLSFRGVGRKTANLVLSVGYGKPAICVDTHVHRIVNRWDYVRTSTPEKTEQALRQKLPPRHWREINALLVLFGRAICKPLSPHCSTCPLFGPCPRRGVTHHR